MPQLACESVLQGGKAFSVCTREDKLPILINSRANELGSCQAADNESFSWGSAWILFSQGPACTCLLSAAEQYSITSIRFQLQLCRPHRLLRLKHRKLGLETAL